MPMVASSNPGWGGYFSDGIFLALHSRRWEHMPWSHITLVVTEFEFKKNGGPRRMIERSIPRVERGGERGRNKSLDRGPHGCRCDADKKINSLRGNVCFS